MRLEIFCALALAACSESSATTAECNDIAQSAASSTSVDLAAMTDAVTLGQGNLPDGFTFDAGMFDGSRLELDYSYMLTCNDAAGNVLAACGPTTDTANISYTWAGSIALATIDATITREGNWTIRGLQSATAQLDGSATFVDDATIASASYHFDSTATYAAVTIDVASQLATAGTITLDIDATVAQGSGAVAFAIPAVVTIASGSATILVDNALEYTVDITTGVATPAGSRRKAR